MYRFSFIVTLKAKNTLKKSYQLQAALCHHHFVMNLCDDSRSEL